MYEYSLDGGTTWSAPIQLSTTNIRSHLIKTAYDYTNNAVWCTWKDEMDFGNIPNNPQADLKAVYIKNTVTPVISSQEFITDHGSSEVALHNFKVGNDGIMRATYNISKLQGKGDTIFYTQRNTLTPTTGLTNYNFNGNVKIYPNPTKDQINFAVSNTKIKDGILIRIFDAQGQLILEKQNDLSPIKLSISGIYFVEITNGETVYYQKIELF